MKKIEPALLNTNRRYQSYGCVHCLDCVLIILLAVFIFCIYVNKLFILIFIFLCLKHFATEFYAPCILFALCIFFVYFIYIKGYFYILTNFTMPLF